MRMYYLSLPQRFGCITTSMISRGLRQRTSPLETMDVVIRPKRRGIQK